jgi:hypothetical protein
VSEYSQGPSPQVETLIKVDQRQQKLMALFLALKCLAEN